MTGFFEEVKRRKVYRVAVAYVIAAGGIIQLASAAFPAWELPSWSLRLVIVLLLIGFPIALILAWAFDVTSQDKNNAGGCSTRLASAPQRHHAGCHWHYYFRRRRIFPAAARSRTQDRQIDRGAAL
jgi:hypothetical protein